jgi:hypothetical protein
MSTNPHRALAIANAVRIEQSRQRKALAGAPPRTLVPALVHPTPQLGKYKLASLIAAPPGKYGVVRWVGKRKLDKVLARIEKRCYRHLHAEMRLEELTERERRLLVKELLPKVAA